MKIAIPMTQGVLCMHFGHCEDFVLLDVDAEKKEIISKSVVKPPAHEPGVLPRWLGELGANLIIAGGMGIRAQQLFNQNNISVIVGAAGETPENLALQYLNGTLVSGDNCCDH
ncbi:MAG: NifB/NifX family molybdenum-iron cluster-binding protein [Desulfobacterales bacterium]|nr:NifB/NifX family molybdenum-iron cluster-binding protein [Desulfobacterales bacterium]MDD4072423.1 NifB/NifX family molybdenum-iron cluster-binding protein [Desulfobacterales bacterium]MDD4393804.1 NifB/NifX family molybdenum-iron cluster-binding protein [Desulfobacterales bacterium]